MEVIVNWERVKFVFDTLIAAWEKKDFPYNLPKAKPPQDENMPKTLERGGLREALKYFYDCLYMRQDMSDTGMGLLSRLYDDHSWLFYPPAMLKLKAEEVEEYLKQYGRAFHAKENARYWVENTRRLVEHWGGDPRNIYASGDYWEICKKVGRETKGYEDIGFFGFKRKMTSMLAYYLVQAGLIPDGEYAIPVDIQVCKTVFGHEFFTFIGDWPNGHLGHEWLFDLVRCISLQYLKSTGKSFVALSNALWIFARTLCKRYPGNRTRRGGGKGRNIILIPEPIDSRSWTHAKTRSVDRSCRICPIRSTCVYEVPQAENKHHGRIITRRKRITPPQGDLIFDLGLELDPRRWDFPNKQNGNQSDGTSDIAEELSQLFIAFDP